MKFKCDECGEELESKPEKGKNQPYLQARVYCICGKEHIVSFFKT